MWLFSSIKFKQTGHALHTGMCLPGPGRPFYLFFSFILQTWVRAFWYIGSRGLNPEKTAPVYVHETSIKLFLFSEFVSACIFIKRKTREKKFSPSSGKVAGSNKFFTLQETTKTKVCALPQSTSVSWKTPILLISCCATFNASDYIKVNP